MIQPIRYCTTADGVRIAFTATGTGHPVVRVISWLTHLEFEQTGPFWSAWTDYLAPGHQLVRYDGRGIGLSDRDIVDFSLAGKLRDVEAVVDALGLARFALVGTSEGGATAVAYTVRHPERVSRLILWDATACASPDGVVQEEGAALQTLIREGWGRESSAIQQLFTTNLFPDADAAFYRWHVALQRVSATPAAAASCIAALLTFDVRQLLAQVAVPTLVIHRRGDCAVPAEAGRELAAGIPGAQLLLVEGRNHLPLPPEPAVAEIYQAMASFLSEEYRPSTALPMEAEVVARPSGAPAAAPGAQPPLPDLQQSPGGLSVREVEVLRLIAAGRSTREIATVLVISEGTVERHVTNLYGKIGARGRADATAYAFRHLLAADTPG